MLRVLDAPPILGPSDVMRFAVGLGAARVDWVARIEDSSESGFVDRQLAGPFAEWVHRHSFAAIDAQTTEVCDEIAAEVRMHPVWGPVGLAIWLGLPALFAYRTLQTRRMLEPRTMRIWRI